MTARLCPGCNRGIKQRMYACRSCWPRLPGDIRTAILRAYGRLQHGVDTARAEHQKASAAAVDWFAGHVR